MKINSIQSQHPSFGKLIIGESISKAVKSNHQSMAFMYELDKIEHSLSILGIDSKKNIDVVLDHIPGEGFFGLISPKKGIITNKEASKCKISTDYHDIITFSNWVDEWDDICSKGAMPALSKPIEAMKKLVNKK